jgi:hypothetical protein
MKRKPIPLARIGPLQQGALDGLCGIYAIINSVRLLCREADRKFCSSLFRLLLRTLKGQVRRPIAIVWRGIRPRILLALIYRCIAYVRMRLRIKLTARRLPKALRKSGSLVKIWHGLNKVVGPNRVAILSIEGIISHWTVAYAVTPKTIRLFDSDGQRALLRSSCAIASTRKRFQLDPRGVVFIERKKRKRGTRPRMLDRPSRAARLATA